MKKQLALFAMLITALAAFAQQTVQVVMPEGVNLPGTEASWLPGHIQDKLKSNLQEYLGMSTVVDSASESKLKQLQRESESSGRDENSAIELGKISTAKFAVFSRIRKTGRGYTISADYTDLTTGVQRATVTSKEYRSAEELYQNTGAIDEITLILADKLNIAINPIQIQALKYGTADFSIDDQLRLARQNEEQFKKMMSQFDEQLRALSMSNDLNAIENTKKIEAEKALLAEKQQSERRRLKELAEQKRKADEDARLEAQRSEEQKKKRDSISAQAAAKAAEVRKLKMERQGVFGQINVIESKKRALLEIRQGIEARIQELRNQANTDMAAEAIKIRSVPWSAGELENGSPTAAAQQRRDNQIAKYNAQREQTFQEEAERVKNSANKQDEELLSEIRKDQQKIKGIRTVSSLGDELKVSYGQYSGENKGWNAYLSLYSESIALLDGTFLIYYQALTGKEAVNLVTASDSDYKDYQDTVNMYTSLLLRGDPILYFEFDYSIRAGDDDDERSKYIIDFKTLRIINTITGKTIQTITVNEWSTILPEPGYDIRTAENIAAERQRQLTQERKQQEKKRNMESQPGYYHELGGGGLGGLGLDFIYIGNNSAAMGVNVYFDVAVRSWLFLNAGSITLYSGGSYEDFNIGGKPAIYPPEYPIAAGFYGGIGLNRRLHISSWHPALYYLLNAGAYIMDKDISENYGREEHETNGYFFLEHSIGLVMPIASYRGIPSFDLNACYSLVTLPAISSKYMGSFSVGVRLTVHPLLRSKYGSYF